MKYVTRGPMTFLLVLLVTQFVVILTNYRHPLITDELYYVAKARYISDHGRFAPIDPLAVAVEEGRAYGTSDWRPPGYPIFLAAISLGDFEAPESTLRMRVTIVQFLLVSGSLAVLLALVIRSGVHGLARYGAAFLLGAPPWTFAFVNDFGPDPVTVPIILVALVLLWRYAIANRPTARHLVTATVVATASLFFRPEMVVLPPAMVAVAVSLRLRRDRISMRHLAAAAIAWAALVGLQAGYHTWHVGRLGVFGGLHIVNAGAFEWSKTWLGTEKEAYDFVYAITEARPARLPNRAFDSEEERRTVDALVARVQARGQYLREDDEAFARLAQEKRHSHPLRVLLLRGWHATNMWFNVENNSPLLGALSAFPRAARRPLYGFLLLLRLGIFILASAALFHTARAVQRRQADVYDLLVLLMLSYAVIRTLLVGVILNWNVHRYVLSAWPPVLWCACVAFRERLQLGRVPAGRKAAAPPDVIELTHPAE